MNVIGVVGWKDTGKTTLVEKLIKEFNQRNFTVSTIKHAHHNFSIDRKGSDSFRHFNAGSRETIVASEKKWVKFSRQLGKSDIDLNYLLKQVSFADIIIVEGFKASRHDKIEVIERKNGREPLFRNDTTICGLIVNNNKINNTKLPQFERDSVGEICDFIEKILGVRKN
jgi:molybdopterin-guanine dinucleotide biosynthesis protein B